MQTIFTHQVESAAYQVESAACQWVNQTMVQTSLFTHYVAMHPNAPYLIILLHLMPDDLTCHSMD